MTGIGNENENEFSVVLDCEFTLANPHNAFHSTEYDDFCCCKSNLQYVIKTVTNKHENKRWAEIILRNNSYTHPSSDADKDESCYRHIWSQTNIKKDESLKTLVNEYSIESAQQ